jgi:uncharacterized membrane protein YraQ (UPF0718 family)
VRELTLGSVFDKSFWVFAALAAATGILCYLLVGSEAVLSSVGDDALLFLDIVPKLIAAMLIAAFVQALLPRDRVADLIGERSGAQGIAIAATAGLATPGGPMTSFPLVYALHDLGTGRAALIAYVTSWSTLGLQRILSWELPLMGVEFALLRFVTSLPLPFVAAAISRFLPRAPVGDAGEP